MRRLSLLLALAVAGGLLISSQVLAADQYEHKSSFKNVQTALTGEQLRQWHLAQEQLQNQVRTVRLDDMQVCEMQRLLNQQGYRIDCTYGGTIDKETMASINRFQRDRGLTVTGMPNMETLDALSTNSGHDEFFGLAPEFGETVD